MSDGSLSQDEIDALLQGSGDMDFGGGGGAASGGGGASISEAEADRFRQIVAATLESQKSNLSMLLNQQVLLERPSAEVVDAGALTEALPEQIVEIKLDFTDGVVGGHLYVMGEDVALAIAGPMMGQEGVELDDAAVNALQEAFSQVSGPVITALGEKSGTTVLTGPPNGRQVSRDQVQAPAGNFVKMTYGLQVGGSKVGDIVEVYAPEVVQAVAGAPQQGSQAAAPQGGFSQPQAAGSAGGPGFAQQPTPQQGGQAMMGAGQGPSAQSVQFPSFQSQSSQGEQGNISLLMDVYMEMTVELGRTRKLIKEILGMGEGTIIELDKLAGEPVDILVNHKLIAKGEVVVIDENFGVRVTEIVSPMERVSNMT
ncbi:MAG: flagellar motor switch phosphatase FliY [Spirochaetaceae bacterium]